MANICTHSIRFQFFEDEGVNKIFILKPSNQQDLPVQSGAYRLWASVKDLPGLLSPHAPLTGNTEPPGTSKEWMFLKTSSFLSLYEENITMMAQFQITIKQIPSYNRNGHFGKQTCDWSTDA